MEPVMSETVCLVPAPTIGYPRGGGHLWEYLNWALALRAIGYRVIWMEGVDLDDGDNSTARRRRWRGADPRECVATLKARLESYGLADTLALFDMNGGSGPGDVGQACLGTVEGAGADALPNPCDTLPRTVGGLP